MQVVQPVCSHLPKTLLFNTINPLIGFVVMVLLIKVCEKITLYLPHGRVLRKIVGLR